MTMIKQNDAENQLPNEINSGFQELSLLKHLRSAGITKSMGFSCGALLKLVFCLIFQHRNWFQLLESQRGTNLPGKDAVYRFLNHPGFAWRRFLMFLSRDVSCRISRLTSHSRVKVLIIDDSMYERNRSKKVELLSRFWDHASNSYYKGFRMLTLGWSDGHSFLPLDFALLSSCKSQLQGVNPEIDKRTHGYRRRKEALQSAPSLVPSMVERALKSGIDATHLLMDSWFTYAPLVKEIKQRGLDVIGMVKNTNQRYGTGQQKRTLKELYQIAAPVSGQSKNVLRVIETTMGDLVVKIVFVRHRTNKREWLALLSTDCTLDADEIIRIYSMRWDIETFFKCTKALLKLQKEFQGRSYDMMISHTTIVFARYILLSWQHRQQSDPRTLCGLFLALCDEIADLDWVIALKQLLDLLDEVKLKSSKKLSAFIEKQLYNWMAALPNYIKAYFPISCCES